MTTPVQLHMTIPEARQLAKFLMRGHLADEDNFRMIDDIHKGLARQIKAREALCKKYGINPED